MKLYRYNCDAGKRCVKPIIVCFLLAMMVAGSAVADTPESLVKDEKNQIDAEISDPSALQLLSDTKQRVAMADAFNAKVRQRVWTAGRLVVGVGTYEQAGGGTGRYNLQISLHDGDGKHTLQQVSDGRLSWTQTIIGEQKSLTRVDVGRLDEWVRASRRPIDMPPRLEVGAFTEMLTNIQRQYIVRAQVGRLKDQKVIIVSGVLKDEVRSRVALDANVAELPELYPTHVRVAIAVEDDLQTRFGKGLPIRFEFRGDPAKPKQPDAKPTKGPLVSLLELYAIRKIMPPPVDRFRFDSQEVINFNNDTDRYLRKYGIRITERQRKQLLR